MDRGEHVNVDIDVQQVVELICSSTKRALIAGLLRMSKLFNLILLTLFLILFVQAGKHSKKSHEKGKIKTLINKKQNQADCYDDIDSPYVFFGTKTSYRWNRNKNDDEVTPPGKKPIHHINDS